MNDKILKMAVEYIECCEDDNLLTTLMSEKDYTNRDCLKIAVDLELLDLIRSPKIESIILRIWNSDYETSGSLMQMSTAY